MKKCDDNKCVHLTYKVEKYRGFIAGLSRWCKLYKNWTRLVECKYDGVSNYCHRCPHFQKINTWECAGGEKEYCEIKIEEIKRRNEEYAGRIQKQ